MSGRRVSDEKVLIEGPTGKRDAGWLNPSFWRGTVRPFGVMPTPLWSPGPVVQGEGAPRGRTEPPLIYAGLSSFQDKVHARQKSIDPWTENASS